METINSKQFEKEMPGKTENCKNPEAAAVSLPVQLEKQKSRGIKAKIPVIITAAAGVVLALAVGISVRTIDGKTMTEGGAKLEDLRNELASVSAELKASESRLESVNAQIESQSKKIKPLENIYDASLAAGTYTVGTDLAPGIYHFTYKLKNSDDSWGDYIYVTYANSEGQDETLGGTKFDYRVEADSDGEQVAIKLDSGSKVVVEGNYGLWNPGKKPIAEE